MSIQTRPDGFTHEVTESGRERHSFFKDASGVWRCECGATAPPSGFKY